MQDWNYKDSGAPKLTPEFKDKYILNIKGKEAISANGLIALGHEKGLRKLTTKVLQLPGKDNNMCCIVQANLIGYGYSPIDKKLIEVEFSAIGDASPSNCSSMVAAAFIRMAETRAVGRVLRNYTDIGMLCSDEIGASVETPIELIEPQQVNRLATLMKEGNITKDQAKSAMINCCNKNDIRRLTKKEADLLISVFYKIKERQLASQDQ